MKGAIHICFADPCRNLVLPDSHCANADLHAAQPTGYLDWHEWARLKSKTHRQVRCDGCGKFNIWEPKPASKRKATP